MEFKIWNYARNEEEINYGMNDLGGKELKKYLESCKEGKKRSGLLAYYTVDMNSEEFKEEITGRSMLWDRFVLQ